MAKENDMIAALLLVTMAAQEPSPSATLSKMIARYYNAEALSGTIAFTQAAGQTSIGIETFVAFSRPSRLLIRQKRTGSEPSTWLAVSDGVNFSYDVPRDFEARPGERLRETVKQGDQSLDIRQIYAAVSRSLGDRSAPLDIVIGRLEDLRYLREQWASVRFVDKPDLPSGVRIVGGDWRAYGATPVSGTYEFWIKGEELIRYVQLETIQPRPEVAPIRVVSRWDVSLKVGGPVEDAWFKLP